MYANLDLPTETAPERGISTDALLTACADERNRRVLQTLREEGEGSVALQELADEVSRHSSDPRRNVMISLHHVHLPKLADLGVVDYDSDEKCASLDVDADVLPVDALSR